MISESSGLTFFYLINGILLGILNFKIFQKINQKTLFSFFDLNILWFTFFFYAPFFWILNRTFLKQKYFDFSFYTLSFSYSTIYLFLSLILIIFFPSNNPPQETKNKVLKVKGISLFFLIFSVTLNFLLETPLAEFILTGSSDFARLVQEDLHSENINAQILSRELCAGLAWIPLVYFVYEKKLLSKLLLFLSSLCLSAFYFSKTGLMLPFLVLFFYYLPIFKKIKTILIVSAGIISLFIGTFFLVNYDNLDRIPIFNKIGERIISETGWAPLHFNIVKESNPPHFYGSRYFFGLNTLFGIRKKVNYSRDAMLEERGTDTGTTSGFAGVPLYAFFGQFWYLAFPIIICIIYFIDSNIKNYFSTTNGKKIFYLFLSCSLINTFTVDVFRVFSPLFLIVPNLVFKTLLGLFVLKNIEKRYE